MKAYDDKRAKAARAANLLNELTGNPVGHAKDRPPREEILPIDVKHHPKKHAPGSLSEGMSVWYRGERWWVERVPKDWTFSASIRIADKPPAPGKEADHHRTTFYVHADCVDVAPTKGTRYDKQTTMAQEQQKARAKSGQTDVGDEAAEMLRGKSIDEAYGIVADVVKVPELALRQKYSHLNPGQQRMNLGNKLRHHLKKVTK